MYSFRGSFNLGPPNTPVAYHYVRKVALVSRPSDDLVEAMINETEERLKRIAAGQWDLIFDLRILLIFHETLCCQKVLKDLRKAVQSARGWGRWRRWRLVWFRHCVEASQRGSGGRLCKGPGRLRPGNRAAVAAPDRERLGGQCRLHDPFDRTVRRLGPGVAALVVAPSAPGPVRTNC